MSSSVGGGGAGGAAGAAADVATLQDKAKELDQLRKEQDEVTTKINKIHKKILSKPADDRIYHFENRRTIAPTISIGSDLELPIVLRRWLTNLLTPFWLGFVVYMYMQKNYESEFSASSALVALLDGLLQSGVSAAPRKKIEVGEQKKKRMKSDTDTARFSSAPMRSQLDQAANLKG